MFAPKVWLFLGLLLLTGVAWAASDAPLLARNRNPIHIKSDQLLTDTVNRTATFIGKVTARQGDMNLFADRMVVHYAAEGGSVEQVECSGTVRFFQKGPNASANRSGSAGHAVYDNREGTIVLTDNPKVYQGEDMLSGAVITYYLADQKSVVTGTPATRVEAVIHPKGKQDAGAAQ